MSDSPQSGQNFAEAAVQWPQAGQATGSGVPHSLQNLLRSATFARQVGQSMQHHTCLRTRD
ncbi:MAG TPA: hypothetical protein VFY72_00685 [Beijerinckiaceae bacterium]|nr:hypothetical protein [Beijerinckiaceae bacterium]